MNTLKNKMNRVHFYSGLTLTLFVGFHLFNHVMSILGVDTHIELMNMLRKVYRNPIIETILMLAVAGQIITGTRLFFRVTTRSKGFYKKLQLYSGLYLAFFLLIHVSVVMIGRFVLDVNTNIYFGSAGLNIFPLNLFFIPYYSLAIMSFFGHIAAIHHEKMNIEVVGLTIPQQSMIILALGLLLTVTILYGLTNGFSGMSIPDEYADLFNM